jgi:hypothetical protein
MRLTSPPRAAVALLACALLMPLLALAQSAPSREQEQIRRLRQQLQQLQQELATARQGEAGARIESANRVAAAEAAARRAQRGAAGTAQRVAELETELTSLRDKAADGDKQLLQRTAERDDARQGLAPKASAAPPTCWRAFARRTPRSTCARATTRRCRRCRWSCWAAGPGTTGAMRC